MWAFNPDTGASELRSVVRLIRQQGGADERILVSVNGETLTATTEHPFWSVDASEWKPAKDLEVGERLVSRLGQIYEIEKIERQAGTFEVFNFEVEGLHNYHVGTSAIRVHNASCVGEEDGLGGETEMGTGQVTADTDLGESLALQADAATSAAAEASGDVALGTGAAGGTAAVGAAAGGTAAEAAGGTAAGAAGEAGLDELALLFLFAF